MTNLIDIRTVKTGVLKSIFEGLKNVVGEGNLFFTPEGIKFCQFNEKTRQIVYLFLDADKFEHYIVSAPIALGINVLAFYRILKLVGSGDVISLVYDDEQPSKLMIRFDDEKQGLARNFYFELLTLEKIMLKPNPITYDVVFTISSAALQKVSKDFHSLDSKIIRFTSIDDQIILSTHDSKTKAEVVIKAVEANTSPEKNAKPPSVCNNLTFDKTNSIPIVGFYPLDAIAFATKTTNINNTVTVYLSNDMPLMISYQTALGDLRFIIRCWESK